VAHIVAIEKKRLASSFKKHPIQDVRDRTLSRSAEPREPQDGWIVPVTLRPLLKGNGLRVPNDLWSITHDRMISIMRGLEQR
jgi:hypothetical protein